MSITIIIADHEPAAAVSRVSCFLERQRLYNPDWSGAEFVIERGDYTCIPGRDDLDSQILMCGISNALQGIDE